MSMHVRARQQRGISLKESCMLISARQRVDVSDVLSKCLEWVMIKSGNRMESSCLELALEGERLCKLCDYRAGVSFFESSLQVGTEDLQILSAIYSQLGNAYYHLQEYGKALEFHRHDLTLTRTIGDAIGEAKASGNLGNTLKVLGQYDEAVVCCERHLEITRAMYDQVGQARALYNFGNVYHAKGKSICWNGAEPGEFSEEARIALIKATEYYNANLSIVKEFGDRPAQGRTYGNLGNTYYLLGDFSNAASAHEQRLLIAKEFGDRGAERRAHCNLGNSFIFLGQFEKAAEHYKRSLQLARLLKDRAVEAQACYSLGNTYTLLQDYERAIDYHFKHLIIAQDLKDRVGEGRACWSLGNAHTALGNLDQAMCFGERHLEISKETGDKSGELTARMNLSDLQVVLSLKANSASHTTMNSSSPAEESVFLDAKSERRPSLEDMERLSLSSDKHDADWDEEDVFSTPKAHMAKGSSKLTFINRLRGRKKHHKKHNSASEEDGTSKSSASSQMDTEGTAEHAAPPDTLGDEGFFDLLSRFQGTRMDDQSWFAMRGPWGFSGFVGQHAGPPAGRTTSQSEQFPRPASEHRPPSSPEPLDAQPSRGQC